MITVTVIKIDKPSKRKKRKIKPANKLKRAKPHVFEHCMMCGVKQSIMYSSVVRKGKRKFICGKSCDDRLPLKQRGYK